MKKLLPTRKQEQLAAKLMPDIEAVRKALVSLGIAPPLEPVAFFLQGFVAGVLVAQIELRAKK